MEIHENIATLYKSDKQIGLALIEFYETMRALEYDPERSDKQVTKTIMTINELKEILR